MSTLSRADRRYPWKVLVVTTFGVTLVFLNSSSVSVALPQLTTQLRATPTQAGWFVFGYMLTLAMFILPFGRISDLVGRRRVYIWGLAAFSTASLLCGFAGDPSIFIVLRVLQGLAAAAIIPNITAQLTDVFSHRDLPRALGFNLMFISCANVLGPVVGGSLVQAFGWRAIFWFNVPVGLVGVLVAARTLRKDEAQRQSLRANFDWVGAAFSACFMAALLFLITFGDRLGWPSAGSLLLIAGALAALAAFIVTERRVRSPLINLRLVMSRVRSLALAGTFFSAIPQVSLVLITSLYLQSTWNLSPLAAGAHVIPMAFGLMVASPFSGRLAQRLSLRVGGTLGGIVMMLGLLVTYLSIEMNWSPLVLSAGLGVLGIGCGLFQPSNTTAVMAALPRDGRGAVNGVRATLQNLGLAAGSALALTVLASHLSPALQSAAYAGRVTALSSSDLTALRDGFAASVLALLVCAALATASALLRGSSGATESALREAEMDERLRGARDTHPSTDPDAAGIPTS